MKQTKQESQSETNNQKKKGFTKIENMILDKHKLTPNQLAVYIHISRFNPSYPSEKRLAARIGIHERTVMRCIAFLVDKGFITKSKRGRSNVYVIVDPEKVTLHTPILDKKVTPDTYINEGKVTTDTPISSEKVTLHTIIGDTAYIKNDKEMNVNFIESNNLTNIEDNCNNTNIITQNNINKKKNNKTKGQVTLASPDKKGTLSEMNNEINSNTTATNAGMDESISETASIAYITEQTKEEFIHNLPPAQKEDDEQDFEIEVDTNEIEFSIDDISIPAPDVEYNELDNILDIEVVIKELKKYDCDFRNDLYATLKDYINDVKPTLEMCIEYLTGRGYITRSSKNQSMINAKKNLEQLKVISNDDCLSYN